MRPQGLNGVFIEYDNRRWFSNGPAVEFSSTQFQQLGNYHGFAVYQASGNPGTIYVASTPAGESLAPFAPRR